MLSSRNQQDTDDVIIEVKSSSEEAKKTLSFNQEDVIKSSNVASSENDADDVKAELKESKEPLSHSIENFKNHLFQAIQNQELNEQNLQAFLNTPEARSVAKYIIGACVILPIGFVASVAVGIARESTDDAMQGVLCTMMASLITSSPFWYKLIKHGCTSRSEIKTRPYTTLLHADQELIKSEGEKIGLIIEPLTTIENILDQVTLLEKDLTEKNVIQSFFTQADSKGIGHQKDSSTKHSLAVFDDKQGLAPIIISYLFPPRVTAAAPPEKPPGALNRLSNYFRKNS
jgi:hypothetical protein